MQYRLTLTIEALDALRAHRLNPETDWSNDTFKNPDGTWDILVTDDTLKRLDEVRFVDESYPDVIIRIASLYGKSPQ